MKFDIIKDFKGSPDGRHAVQYKAGDKEVELTDSLAEVALGEGWVKKSKADAAKAKSDAEAKAKADAEAEVAALEKQLAAAAAPEEKSKLQQAIDTAKQKMADFFNK